MFYNPFTFIFFIIFFSWIIIFFVIVQMNVIAIAFAQIGISSQYAFAVLLATLLGSFINIPLKRIPQETMTHERRIGFFGFRHVCPVWTRKETVVALNLGGAVVALVVSIYLLFKTNSWGSAAVATAFVTLITLSHGKARARSWDCTTCLCPALIGSIGVD